MESDRMKITFTKPGNDSLLVGDWHTCTSDPKETKVVFKTVVLGLMGSREFLLRVLLDFT